MKPRICICCGEFISKTGKNLSANHNTCEGCCRLSTDEEPAEAPGFQALAKILRLDFLSELSLAVAA